MSQSRVSPRNDEARKIILILCFQTNLYTIKFGPLKIILSNNSNYLNRKFDLSVIIGNSLCL